MPSWRRLSPVSICTPLALVLLNLGGSYHGTLGHFLGKLSPYTKTLRPKILVKPGALPGPLVLP